VQLAVFVDFEFVDPIDVGGLRVKHAFNQRESFTQHKKCTHEILEIEIGLTLD